MPAPPITVLPTLPVYPTDQPRVFFPRLLTYLSGLGVFRTELTALAAYLEGLSVSGGLLPANNLSDLADPATARTNLGLLRTIASFFTTAPTAAEVLLIYPVVEAMTLAANLAGSQVLKLATGGVNPAAAFAIDVKNNGATIATISISTGGVVTLTTTSGTAKALAVGDLVSFHGPATADTGIANWGYNLKGAL